MPYLIVDVGDSQKYIDERWKITVKRHFNVKKNNIIPQPSEKPGSDTIKCLVVGRAVQQEQIEAFLKGYFYGKGLWERIVRIQFT